MFWRRHGGSDNGAIGATATSAIQQAWSAHKSELTACDHGFDWLPGSHFVRVRVDESDHSERTRISVTTDFLHSVPVGEQSVLRQIGVLPQYHCATYAISYGPEDLREGIGGHQRDLQFCSTAYVDANLVGWLPFFLAQMSLMQPIDAELFSGDAPDFLGGGVPAFADGLKASAVNGVLNMQHELRVDGQAPSRWIGSDEFETFAQVHAKSEDCFGFGDTNGLTLETPFGSDTGLLTFSTEEESDALGNGLTLTTQIRLPQSFDGICARAAQLNYLEATQWTDFPLLGGWCAFNNTQQDPRLVHRVFVPNAYFRPGLVTNLGLWAIARVAWARTVLLPDVRNETISSILKARLVSEGGTRS